MSCSGITCRLNGIEYSFEEDNLKQYRDAVTFCNQATGGSIALANSDEILTKLRQCCKSNNNYWIARSPSGLTSTSSSCFRVQMGTTSSPQTDDCNTAQRFICQAPYFESTTADASTSYVSSSAGFWPTTNYTNGTEGNHIPRSATPDSDSLNPGVVLGVVFSVLFAIVLLLTLFRFRFRNLTRESFSKPIAKKCNFGCCAAFANPGSDSRAAQDEDHGYYSIQVQEPRPASNSDYSYITDLGSRSQSANPTPQLAGQRRPSHATVVHQDSSNPDYDSIQPYAQGNFEPEPQTQIPLRKPPDSAPPSPPDQETRNGSGVTYATLQAAGPAEDDEAGSGVSYTTVLRVMDQAPKDVYTAVRKSR